MFTNIKSKCYYLLKCCTNNINHYYLLVITCLKKKSSCMFMGLFFKDRTVKLLESIHPFEIQNFPVEYETSDDPNYNYSCNNEILMFIEKIVQ